MDTDLTSFSCNISAQTTFHELIEYLIKSHGILHNIASDHGIPFTASEVQGGAYAHVIHRLYHLP